MLDLIEWKLQNFMNSSMEFRHFWLSTNIFINSEFKEINKINQRQIILIDKLTLSLQNLIEIYTK